MNDKPLTIGRLARELGINVETVRYYERRGLIRKPPKPMGGYRIYDPDTRRRIRFIKRAQALGFQLGEIAELLALGEGHCSDVRELAEAKRDRIDDKIRSLTALRNSLEALIQACHNGKGDTACPIVHALAGDE